MNAKERYIKTHHVCRSCGVGRIMQQANSGVTGWVNAIFACSSCTSEGAAISPAAFCFCGFVDYSNDFARQYACHDLDHAIPSGWRMYRQVYDLHVIRKP